MPNVSMPNGDVVFFPDDMPKEQIRGLIQQKFPEVSAQQPPQEKTFGSDVWQAALERNAQALDAQKQGFPRNVIRQAGAGAGFVGDVVGAGLSAITPDVIGKPISEAVGYVAQPVVKGLGYLNTAAPETMKDFGAMTNIAAVMSPKTAFGGKMSADITEKAAKKTALKYVSEGMTEDALLKGRVKDKPFGLGVSVTPSFLEESQANALTKVKGFTHRDSVVKTINKAGAEVSKEADSLIKRLENGRIIKSYDDGTPSVVLKEIPRQEVEQRIASAFDTIPEKHAIVGEGLPEMRRMRDTILRSISENPSTPAGLLRARKDFDAAIFSRYKNIANADVISAKKTAAMELRRTLNDMIAEYSPEAGVKESLAKQSALLDARESAAVYALKTPQTPIGKVLKKIPLKGEIAGGLALTGLGTAGYLNPVSAGLAGGGYLAYRGITSPTTRSLAAKGLQGLESAGVPQLGLVDMIDENRKKYLQDAFEKRKKAKGNK